tara:strand:- start:5489 stop:5845 length:357 start_codon:yes stop_codon:yes gene_type:complete
MQLDIKKTTKRVTCTIVLPETTPVHKHGNTGRIMRYENYQTIKAYQVKDLIQKELGEGYVVGNQLEGPNKLINTNNDEREGVWVFEIKTKKSLTKTSKSNIIDTDTEPTNTRKRKTKK